MSTLSLKEAANYIVSGFQTIGTTVTATFQQLQSTLDSILPKLNKEEQQDVITAVSQYTKVLMTTQEFVSFTLVGVKYAETREHLCKAVPTETLSKLISEVESLLNTFLQLQFVIQRKMEEECRLPAFRNIFLGKFLLGGPYVSYKWGHIFSSQECVHSEQELR